MKIIMNETKEQRRIACHHHHHCPIHRCIKMKYRRWVNVIELQLLVKLMTT